MDKQHLRRHILVGYKLYRKKFPHIKLTIVALFAVVLICALFLLRIIAKELPRGWVDKIEKELSTDAFSVELDGVSISLKNGLCINDVAVYPKRIPHRPIVSARQVRMDIDFFSTKPLVSKLQSVQIDSFELISVSHKSSLSKDKESVKNEGIKILPVLKNVSLQCRRARIFETNVFDIEAYVSMHDTTISCNDIALKLTKPNQIDEQQLTGNLKYDLLINRLDFSGDGKLKTETLYPLFEDLGLKGLNRELEKIEFPSMPPNVSANIKYSPNESIYNLDLNVDSGHVKYNGVDFVSLVMYLKAHGKDGWSNVDINSLVGRRPEGMLSGSLYINLDTDVLNFDVISKIRPGHMLTAVGVIENEELFPLDVELPCQMSASGSVGISRSTSEALNIEGNFTARSINFNGLMFEDASGKVDMDYESWNVKGIETTLYNGGVKGDICVTPEYVPNKGLSLEKVNFAVNFDCNNASVDSFINAFTSEKAEKEAVSGVANFNGYLNFDIAGKKDDLRTMVGAATISIEDAMIYRIPIFAGFTDFMARNVPGLDFILTQSSLKSELTIKDYGVHFKNLLIDGPAISVTGYGDLWFTGHLDAFVRVNLLSQETWVGKGLHYILFPISKMFELQAYGPINELTWTTRTLGLGDKETTPEQRGETGAK